MISANGSRNPLVAHYDWLALGLAVIAVVGAVIYAVGAFGEEPDDVADMILAEYCKPAPKPGATGVVAADMEDYQRTVLLLDSKKVPHLAEFDPKAGSFLASGTRVFCEHEGCRRPMPAGAAQCPFCKQAPIVKEIPVVTVDSDGDGMIDEWEQKYGLNPSDPSDAELDRDGDGFSNLEEYTAKTDPTKKNDHPDYLDSLAVNLPLLETRLPFYFEKVNKIPSGYRFYFKDPSAKNDYGKKGLQYTPLAGEDIGKTGYKVVSYNEKLEERTIKAVAGEQALKKTVDVSTATIERKSDKRRIDLQVGNTKLVAVDVQAKLFFSRGGGKELQVVAGDTIDLYGTKYVVKKVEAVGKGAKVTVADTILGKIRVLEALEQ